MGLLDAFKGQQYKNALETLQKEYDTLKSVITPEMQDVLKIKQEIDALQDQKRSIEASISDLNDTVAQKISLINTLDGTIREKNQKIIWMDDEILVQEFGLYQPTFDFASSLDYKEELGDASVPFNFDVHAMIFSDDAPALEAALHRAFEDKKLNMVDHRREFFRVTLDEIKEVVKNDKTVEFIDVPDAEQYRISMKMRSGDQ